MPGLLQPTATVGQLVAERPARSRLFERLGIDYCCGGKLPLSEACAAKGLDASSVLATLEAMEESAPAGEGSEPDPASLTLTELCDLIEATHHVYLRNELPRIEGLAAKVLHAHGQSYPWVVQVAEAFGTLQEDLMVHLLKEEQILFPSIRALEAGQTPQTPCGGHLEGPISVMEHDHDNAGRALERLRSLTSGYTPPDGACNTFRALMDALADLEANTHQHVHKENNILFVRALERFGPAA